MEMTAYVPGTPCWIDLGSPDVEASKSFYRDLFAWEPVASPDHEAGGYTLFLLRGIPVAGVGPLPAPGVPPWWTTYISVEDAEAALERAAAAGGTTIMAATQVLDAGTMGVFQDTVGATCAVWQPAAHAGCGLVNEQGTLCWNELACRETGPAVDFYREVFGWSAKTYPMGGAMTYTEFAVEGRAVAGMMQMTDEWPPEVPAHWMVYFATDDVDATCARLTELGGTVSVPPTEIEPGRFAVVNDPQGAVFSLLTMKAELLGS